MTDTDKRVEAAAEFVERQFLQEAGHTFNDAHHRVQAHGPSKLAYVYARGCVAAADTISPPSDPARDKAMTERGAERMRERCARVADRRAKGAAESRKQCSGYARRTHHTAQKQAFEKVAEAIRALPTRGGE